ncbi:MAG: hypothetical protein ACYC3X_30500 [Pirellulaceae bacterium]
MAGKGDSDFKAYVIAVIGGLVGGAFGSKAAVVLGAYLPVLIYPMGLDIPSDAAGLGDSNAKKGTGNIDRSRIPKIHKLAGR